MKNRISQYPLLAAIGAACLLPFCTITNAVEVSAGVAVTQAPAPDSGAVVNNAAPRLPYGVADVLKLCRAQVG